MIRGWNGKGRALLAGVIGILLLSTAVAWADQGPSLTLRNLVEKELKRHSAGKGVTELVPVDRVSPGETLVYTTRYRNDGKSAATGAVIVNPIPPGVRYLPESAEGQDAEISYSIDGSRSWQRPPVMTLISKADGTQEKQPALPEQYTHIRWGLKQAVQPGQSGQVRYKATVK